MKKLFFPVTWIVALVGAIAYGQNGGVQMLGRFGPTANAGVALSTPAVFQIPASSTGRNCLKNLDVTSNSSFTLRVLDDGTTVYAVDVSSGGGIIRAWDDNDLMCGSLNTAMRISVSSGSFRINYSGFMY